MEEEKEVRKEKKERGEGKSWKLFIFLVIFGLVILIVLLYLAFHTQKCTNIDCFNSAMEKCKKASFINEAEDASWLYTIEGKQGSFGCSLIPSRCSGCLINVQLLQVKNGTGDTKAIEGLDMNCELAIGAIGIPNADLTNCHGNLREGLQDLMIKKMHSYILTNVGKIGEEMNRAI